MPRKTYIYDRASLSHRTTLTLTKKMDTFLKELSQRCKEGNGRFMDKTQLIRAVIQVLMDAEARLDLAGVRDETQLIQRLSRALRKG